MQATIDEWQRYKFMKHELPGVDKSRKGKKFDFRIVIAANRVISHTPQSDVGSDLLNVLQLSQTGSALLATNRYEFVLDKQHMLSVSRQSLSTPTADNDQSTKPINKTHG